MYEKQGELLDEWAKHERRPYLRGKVVDFLVSVVKSQLSGQTKHRLCTKCSDHYIGGLGRPRLWTDAEDSFFPGTGHTYPHLDEIHASRRLLPGAGTQALHATRLPPAGPGLSAAAP
jgi:hypothetical protein